MNFTDVDDMRRLSVQVQSSLDEMYEAVEQPEPDSPLDQLGLRDGCQIVGEYLEHSEYGLAFEHLLYMIEEPEIPVDDSALTVLLRLGATLDMTAATERALKR